MDAPRRVPYASLNQLQQIHALIQADPQLAISHLALLAVHSPSSIPTSLSLTHALLSALSPCSSPQTHRLALSSALVRFINSLIDPLQQGLYARPLALLARDLGLPGWLVELRHAATHDDLPSLSLLLEGAREALAYLDKAYWLPTLDPSTASSSESSWSYHLSLLPALLSTYKKLAKAKARDSTTFGGPLKACLAELGAWVGAVGNGRDKQERILGELCRTLVDSSSEGYFVPQAKKKRPSFTPSSPFPPPLLLSTYLPLISLLAQSPLFLPILSSTLLNSLSAPTLPHSSSEGEQKSPSRSEQESKLSWLAWTVDEFTSPSREEFLKDIAKRAFGEGEGNPMRVFLTVGAKVGRWSEMRSLKGALRLLGIQLDESLLPPLAAPTSTLPTPTHQPALSALSAEVDDPALEQFRRAGWSLVQESEWRAVPLGVKVGSS